MRVALACDWFLKYASTQTAALARAGAEVMLLCRDHALEFGGDEAERRLALEHAAGAGVRIVELHGRLWDWTSTGELVRIGRHLRRFSPDVVHAHAGADPRMLALLPGAPLVLTIHDLVPHPGQPVPRPAPRRWFLDGARRAWRRRASVIVVHSTRLRAQLMLRPDQRCVVIPHGMQVRDRPLPPPPHATVGFFGRLAPYKGLDVLARAMPRIWATHPDVQLHVAGEGDARLMLEDPRVRLDREYLPEAELERYFASVSVAALPYTEASQTGAGSTAIGYGVPIVASRLGGLSDLTLDQSYLFEAGDDAGLAAQLVAHLGDDASVRDRVLAELAAPRSWDAVAQRSLALYEGLAAPR